MTEFNPDAEIEPEEEGIAEDAPEQSSNRTFILIAVGLGGLFIVGLICIALYAFLIVPQQQAGRVATAEAINAANTQVALDAALTANPATNTPEPTFTLEPTTPPEVAPSDTPVIAIVGPSATFTATNTAGPSPTPSRTPTRIGGSAGTAVAAVTTTVTGTPTRIQAGGITATASRTFTATAPGGVGGGGETRTPTPTALPDTGIADNFGGPGLFILAAALVVVLFFARQLRLRNS